jgi:predicted transcriptional regulator
MKLIELIKTLSLTVYSPITVPDIEVTGGYACDLLSDVMGSVDEGQIWITLQTHRNVAAIAKLKDVAAVLLVKGLKPDQEMLDKALTEEIPILGTNENTFEISGKIYQLITQ